MRLLQLVVIEPLGHAVEEGPQQRGGKIARLPAEPRLLIMNRSGSTRKIIPRRSPADAPPSHPERRTKGRQLGCSSRWANTFGKAWVTVRTDTLLRN